MIYRRLVPIIPVHAIVRRKPVLVEQLSAVVATLSICLMLSNACGAAVPVQVERSQSSVGQKLPHSLQELLQRESDKFSVTILVEGQLPDVVVEDADFQRVSSIGAKQETLTELSKLADHFNLEMQVRGSAVLLTKRYIDGKNIPPSVTLRECRQSVRQMLIGLDRLFPGLGPGKADTDVSLNTSQALFDSFSEADWKILSSGFLIREMSPEQQILFTTWAVSEHVGDLIRILRGTESRLDDVINQSPALKHVAAKEISKNLPDGNYFVCDLTGIKTPYHYVLLDHFDPFTSPEGKIVTVIDSSPGLVIMTSGPALVNGRPVASPALPVAGEVPLEVTNVKGLDTPDLTKRLDEVLADLNSRETGAKQKVSYVTYEDISDKRVTIIGGKYTDAPAMASSIAELYGFSLASAKNDTEYTIRPPLVRNLEALKIGDGMLKLLPKPLLRAWTEAVITEKAPQPINVYPTSVTPTAQTVEKRVLRRFAAKRLQLLTDEVLAERKLKAIPLSEMPYDAEPVLATIIMTPLINALNAYRVEGIPPSILDNSKLSLTSSRFVDEKGKDRLNFSLNEVMPDSTLHPSFFGFGKLYTPHK